jgi:hypothetical protein
MLKLEKVATPATAATLIVPLRVPLPEPIAIVTMFVAVGTTLPFASSTLTVTENVPPAEAFAGCEVNASFAGGPIATDFEVVHPAMKARAASIENPIMRLNTPRRPNRKSLSITAILFGQRGFQVRNTRELG